jgi:hypothetical protein
MDTPLYLSLGMAESGRRALWGQLLASVDGGEPLTRPRIWLSEREAAEAASRELIEATGAELGIYRIADRGPTRPPELEVVAAPDDSTATGWVLIADGRASPLDIVEAVAAWAPAEGAEVVRVVTVVDCARLRDEPRWQPWYDACIHFSDMVLLAGREGISNRWVSDFEARFHKQCFPCGFDLVRRTGVRNPALVLYPEARRISQVFDLPDEDAAEDWRQGLDPETEIIDSGDPAPEGEDDDGDSTEDPWLARHDTGYRIRRLPEIAGDESASDSGA